MKLVCEKYKIEYPAEDALCEHREEYCKFRGACIIHYRSEERRREVQKEKGQKGDQAPAEIMDTLNFNKGAGLLPAIAQDHKSGEILMMAYINRESWEKTLETGKAHYWSRSRNQLWLKGESSGHVQEVKEILVDCDEDTVVFKVEQLGGAACHKGYHSCFFRKVEEGSFVVKANKVFDPQEVYKK